MYLSEDKKSSLKDWLISKLATLGVSTDADVLADYTLALLDRDLDVDAHKKYVVSELEMFIDSSSEFTNDLFKMLAGEPLRRHPCQLIMTFALGDLGESDLKTERYDTNKVADDDNHVGFMAIELVFRRLILMAFS
jgi:hypothetical protein